VDEPEEKFAEYLKRYPDLAELDRAISTGGIGDLMAKRAQRREQWFEGFARHYAEQGEIEAAAEKAERARRRAQRKAQ